MYRAIRLANNVSSYQMLITTFLKDLRLSTIELDIKKNFAMFI